MIELIGAELDAAELALETYKKYGDCGHRSSAELARLQAEVLRLREEYFCAVHDC